MKLFLFRGEHYFVIIFFSLFTSSAQSQGVEYVPTPQEADSLKTILQTTNNDTLKMVICKNLAIYYHSKEVKTSYLYNEQRLKLAQKLHQKIWEGQALELRAFYDENDSVPKLLESLKAAKIICDNEENEKNMYIEPRRTQFSTPHTARIALSAQIEAQNAYLFRRTGKCAESAQGFFKAIKISESINDEAKLCAYYSGLQQSYRCLEKQDSAEWAANKAIYFSKKTGTKDDLFINYSFLATIYTKKKDFATAKKYLLEALKVTKELNSSVKEAYTYMMMAFLFRDSHRPDSTILYYKKAKETYIQWMGYPPNAYYDIYLGISDAFKEKGKIDSAYYYLQLSVKATEGLYHKDNDNLKKMQNFYLEEQKKLKDAEKKNIQQQNYGLLAGLGLFAFIGFILNRNNRQKQKANAKLQITLKELEVTQNQLIEKEHIATDAAARLQELDNVKTRLYTNITHEFRTPLTIILGVTQNVQETLARSGNFKSSPNVDVDLSTIKRNGQNLLTLVNQMLDLSKLESGALALHYQQGDVVTFIKYLTESFHSLAENKNLTIQFHSDADSFLMDYDEIRLQQVVSNLLTNAIKFTPENGKIDVVLECRDAIHRVSTLILKIKDNGIGISDSELPYIFDRFYQADTSATRHGEGTGIGLALTQELVKLMEGSIAVKSVLGEGTEFTVELPVRRDAIHRVLINQQFEPMNHVFTETQNVWETSKVSRTFRNHEQTDAIYRVSTILIADDNVDVRTYISSILSTDYNLIFAKDGQECEELAFEHTPDLIISDVMMPRKDGFEVCKNLKTDVRTSHIPIIMLTAKADMDSKLEGLEQGADVYIMKPFNKEELLLRIKKLLELRQQLQNYYLSFVEPRHALSSESLSETNQEFSSTSETRHTLSLQALDSSFVKKVKATIDQKLTDADFDAEKLSREMALSHSQLNRKLTALTGLSANSFIRYIRLIKAKELLLHSTYTINAIAYDSGFNDPAYFNRIFKQEFGVTPHVWREKNSN